MTTKKEILDEMDKIEIKAKFRQRTKEENEAFIECWKKAIDFVKRRSWIDRLFNNFE